MVVRTLIVNTMPQGTDKTIEQDDGVVHSAGSDPPDPPSRTMGSGTRRQRRRRLRRRESDIPKGMEGLYYLP